ncbi:hypothetical protein OE88DRAFT_1657909 [Heliocybe sulcata]|uniref:Histidine-specific methyltransferase SAM-dependent domain-containing protein n=1 Tax=Heliocybe sulcata TaxID=5364 RepID=A0A5C3NGA9_9AGAM|nr:hypothetical protein OE88DRAFT_1657909 [Heliocybe sulcata]
MPPQYHDQSFWDKRFEDEVLFEWLGDGQDTILPSLTNVLKQYKSNQCAVPEILHIGAGTSAFQEYVKDVFIEVYGADVDCGKILNTDFSENAVTKGRHAASNLGTRSGMRWAKADLLKWKDIQNITSNVAGRFSVVLDKSTSDAISCGPSMTIGAKMESDINPIFQEIWSRYSPQGLPCSLAPLELLAMNLAFCVEPGGIWIALSYSSNRFPFLQSSSLSASTNDSNEEVVDLSNLWSIERMIAVDAPSGQEKPGVHAPNVQHHLYVLRRMSWIPRSYSDRNDTAPASSIGFSEEILGSDISD